MQIWNLMPKLHKKIKCGIMFFYFLMSTDLKSQGRRVAKSQSINSLCDLMTLRPYDLTALRP